MDFVQLKIQIGAFKYWICLNTSMIFMQH